MSRSPARNWSTASVNKASQKAGSRSARLHGVPRTACQDHHPPSVAFSRASIASRKRGSSSMTIPQMILSDSPWYSWRRTLPIARTFCQGTSGRSAWTSDGTALLALEMISMPRRTPCRSDQSPSQSVKALPAVACLIPSIASWMSSRACRNSLGAIRTRAPQIARSGRADGDAGRHGSSHRPRCPIALPGTA